MSVDRSRLPSPGAAVGFRFPPVARTVLSNGIDLALVERGDVPVVAFHLLVRAGSFDDPVDRAGLAALTADLLDEGCGELDSLAFHEAIARIGGQLDVETSADATIITLVTLSRFARRALELLADLAFRPRFDQRDFDRVRDIRVSRLAQLRDVPAALAERAFVARLFGGHPYGHLPLGDAEALRRVTVDDVVGFHRQAFRPAESTVVVSGAAPLDEVGRMAGDLIGRHAPEALAPDVDSGGTSAGGRSAGETASEPGPSQAARLVVIDRPGAPQSELRVGRVALSRATPDYHGLLVVNALLGGQFSSRLNMNLREQKGYTYGARSYFEFRRRPGPFAVQTSVQTTATVDALRQIYAELEDLGGRRPATDVELDLARASLTRGFARNFETAEQVGRAVMQLALYGLPDLYYDEFPDRVWSIGQDTVTRLARKWLEPGRMATVVVGDHEVMHAELATLDLGEPFVVEPR